MSPDATFRLHPGHAVRCVLLEFPPGNAPCAARAAGCYALGGFLRTGKGRDHLQGAAGEPNHNETDGYRGADFLADDPAGSQQRLPRTVVEFVFVAIAAHAAGRYVLGLVGDCNQCA